MPLAYLYLYAAFDVADLVIYCIIKKKIWYLVDWLRCDLNDTQQYVAWDNCVCDKINHQYGVPQWSVLESLPFIRWTWYYENIEFVFIYNAPWWCFNHRFICFQHNSMIRNWIAKACVIILRQNLCSDNPLLIHSSTHTANTYTTL